MFVQESLSVQRRHPEGRMSVEAHQRSGRAVCRGGCCAVQNPVFVLKERCTAPGFDRGRRRTARVGSRRICARKVRDPLAPFFPEPPSPRTRTAVRRQASRRGTGPFAVPRAGSVKVNLVSPTPSVVDQSRRGHLRQHALTRAMLAAWASPAFATQLSTSSDVDRVVEQRVLLLLGLLLLRGLLSSLRLLRFLRHAALLAVSWLAMS